MAAADWRTKQRAKGRELRVLLLDADLKQVDVAEAMEIHAPHMSQFLNARRRWPEDFEERFRKAVKALSRGSR